jgi:hypothetical protein
LISEKYFINYYAARNTRSPSIQGDFAQSLVFWIAQRVDNHGVKTSGKIIVKGARRYRT